MRHRESSGKNDTEEALTLKEDYQAASLFSIIVFNGFHEIAALSSFGSFSLRKRNGEAFLSAQNKQSTKK